jgi:hypothetical protein
MTRTSDRPLEATQAQFQQIREVDICRRVLDLFSPIQNLVVLVEPALLRWPRRLISSSADHSDTP